MIVGLVVTGLTVASTGTITPQVAQPDDEETNQSFDVSDLTVTTDGTVEVSANITNPDTVPMIQPVEFRLDGELIESRPWALNPGETERITFTTGNGTIDDGTVISVLTREHGEVEVFEREPTPPEASISFEDQTSDGTSVVVANVSNPETPYYAAVWTVNNSSGEPETLLGASQVTQSNASNVSVAFDEPINESQTLIAAVHPDLDGNESTIDPDTETILASDTASVTIEVEPPVEAGIAFEDQTSDGTGVVVANVSNPETPYYAAVWTVNNSSGAPETLLGASQVTEPEASNVTVAFDESINESQTLVAAVHPDLDGNESTIDPDTETILASDTANVTVEAAPPVEAGIAFEDQTTDGNSVVVASASNPETPYYAAVWTVNNSSGAPETLLGAAQLTDTEASNVSVAFDESINESQTLIAAVHPDLDGNESTIDPDTETILASDTANVTVEVAPPAEASVSFEDQTSDGTTVAVASTTLPEGGFVVIHDTSLNESDAFGSVVGVSEYLGEGTSENVTVTLREPINESQRLIAMAHMDTNDNQTYDFEATNGSEDGPYTVNGSAVIDAANVTVEAAPAEPSITFEDQTSDGTGVVVANVSNPETPYYAAVWTLNESTGAPGTLLGASQLTETSASNVSVTFEEPINESQTLIAAVHPDIDGNASTVDPNTTNILTFDTANVTVEAAPPAEASVTFEDQTSDGMGVVVANVSNPETPYYAAVWTVNNSTGEPAMLLGASQLTETSASNVSVAFDEPINESQTLIAAVHPDVDGNASTVDPNTTDIRASDTANVTVEVAPPVEAGIAFEDQTTDGNSVVVASASNPETPYYAAVWTQNASSGEPETLLGAAQLTEPEASNVSVAFDEPINESQTLIAAVHPDVDGNESTIDPDTETILASDTANVTVEVAPPAEASVSFENQTSDGTNVTIASTTLPDGGFVAINNATDIVGVSEYLEAGTYENLTVTLFQVPGRDQIRNRTQGQNGDQLRNQTRLRSDQTLTAVVHRDTNANQSFDYVLSNETDDGPYVDANGTAISDDAYVTLGGGPSNGASITFEDQDSDGASAVVANATSPEAPFYAAIWTVNASTGAPETFLGAAPVDGNQSADLTVNFETSITESQTLIAAVHPDADGNVSTFDPVTTEILASDTANVTINGGVEPGEAKVVFDDQTSDGTSGVVTKTAYARPPYYTAIWRFNSTNGGIELIGSVQTTQNTSYDQVVTLEKPITESQLLVAAIHPDADGDASTYDPVTDVFVALDTADVRLDGHDYDDPPQDP